MEPIWKLCNCKSEEEWNKLTPRARYDRKYRRGLNNPCKYEYSPSLNKCDLEKYIADIIVDDTGSLGEIVLVDNSTALISLARDYTAAYLGKGKWQQLHRVLYAWFIGPIPKNYVVDHIDNNKHNNNLNNLQLLSRADNVKKDYKVIKNQYTTR